MKRTLFLITVFLLCLHFQAEGNVGGLDRAQVMNDGGERDYIPLINKDRIWHYKAYDAMILLDSAKQNYEYGDVEFRMQFVRDTILEGKTYTILQTTAQRFLGNKAVPAGSSLDTIEGGPGITLFPFREEGRRVYMHRPICPDSICDYSKEWPYESPECVMYDFSLKSGDSFESTWWWSMARSVVNVVSIGTVEDENGLSHTVQTYEYCSLPSLGTNAVYEGIGPGENPFISLVSANDAITSPGIHKWNTNYPMFITYTDLVKVTDLAGNIIYAPGIFSGLDETVVTPESEDGPYYDLMGIRVTNPQPGSIYIRNGKKFVMK